MQRVRELHDEVRNGQSMHHLLWCSDALQFRETVLLRHVLKHLRQRRFLTPYHDILSRSGMRVEHPTVTSLHEAVVLQGNWARAEQLIRDASDAGLFDAYRHACQPHARWARVQGMDADGDVPCRRGGHAMCIDEENGRIYLFGGWDGQRSLDDFWVYDIAQDMWQMLSPATSREANGPGPRACHKIVYDSTSGSIFLLGRLQDANAAARARRATVSASDEARDNAPSPGPARSPSPPVVPVSPGSATGTFEEAAGGSVLTDFASDFHRYHTRGPLAGTWSLISADTSV